MKSGFFKLKTLFSEVDVKILKLITTKQCTQRCPLTFRIFYITNAITYIDFSESNAVCPWWLSKNMRYSNQNPLVIGTNYPSNIHAVTWFVCAICIQSVWKEYSKALSMQTIHIILKIGEAQCIEMHLKCASRRIMAAFRVHFHCDLPNLMD